MMRSIWLLLATISGPFMALCQNSIFSWEGDTALWELTPYTAVLNAPGPGAATISRCFLPPDTFTEGLDLRWRWIQNLAGSNANRSSIRLFADSITFMEMALGTSGTDDPLEIQYLQGDSNAFIALQHGTWAMGMDAQFRWLQLPGSAEGTAYNRAWNANAYAELATTSGHPTCLSLTATFTSSNTQNFALHLEPSIEYVPDTIAPFITSAIWFSDTLLRITFSERIADLPDCFWPEQEGALCQFAGGSAANNDCILCQPPLAGVPAGTPLIWSAHFVQDTCGNSAESLIASTCAFPVEHVLPGQIQITEIMADPTPSENLPAMEWVELTNFGTTFVQIESLTWRENSGASSVIALRGWDGQLGPEQRCILATDTNILVEGVFQAHLPDGGTLLDGGECIEILRQDGLLLDEVCYEKSWWGGAPGGTSIGLSTRGACGLASFWLPESPASPGHGEENAPAPDSLRIAAIRPIHPSLTKVIFTHEIAPHRIGSIHSREGQHWALIPDSPHSAIWRGALAEGPAAFNVRGIASCTQAWGETSELTILDSIGSFPQIGELVLSEIAVQSPAGWTGFPPFVEWTNMTSKTLEIGGVTVNGTPAGPRRLGPFASVTVPIDLPNTQGKIRIEDGQGELLEHIWYSACWHADRSLESDGVSLERLDLAGPANDARNWNSSTAPMGCSPGWVHNLTVWKDEIAPQPAAFPRIGNAQCIWFSEPVTPSTPTAFEIVDPFEIGMDFGQCWCWKSAPNPAKFADFSGNVSEAFPPETIADDASFMLNECLSWVTSSAEPFIEILGKHEGWASTSNWIWSSAEMPFGSDWQPISAEDWIIDQGKENAWARCPQRLGVDRAFPSTLPSLYGDHLITLAALNGGWPIIHDTIWSSRDRFDPQQRLNPGTSWERFHESPGAWAPSLTGSTPGSVNSQRSQNAEPVGDRLNVAPRTCIPFDADWGQMSIQLILNDQPEVERIWIANAQGRTVKLLLDLGEVKPVNGNPWLCFWDGLEESGIPVVPGGYWVIAQGPAGRIKEAIPVLVAPPRD